MVEVKFYDPTELGGLNFKYAVIATRYNGSWVYAKHRDRTTYEIPGGHIEEGEAPIQAARRELYEETGALRYDLHPVSAYSVTRDNGDESFGMLYFAQIHEIGALPCSEIECIKLFDEPCEVLTYPLIQPILLDRVMEFLKR